MFDIGWSELLLIGVVALIVVGPKELPRLLRTVGQYVGRAKGVAREFQRSMDDAAREMDVQELRDAQRHLSDLKSMKMGDLDKIGNIGGGVKSKSSQVHASSEPRPKPVEAPAPSSAPAAAAAKAEASAPDAAEAKDA
jgi:sec-independent protein translocase protein TatB